MLRFISFVGLFILLIGAQHYIRPASAEPEGHLFAETGYSVREPFLSRWQAGGLAVFGYPISPELVEQHPDNHQHYIVQYFERARFELHPESAQIVQLGRLGAEHLVLDPDLSGLQGPEQSGCSFFAQTGQQLCGDFALFWSANGGLDVFGYPMGPAKVLVAPNGIATEIQYTERARFEREVSSHQVQLGLLGSELKPLHAAIATARPTELDLNQEVRQLVDLINQERAAAGLAPLSISLELMRAAQVHSLDMATSGQISHTGSDGRSASQRISDAGYLWQRCGENIAVGQPSPEVAMDFWMHSPPHRANILDPGMEEVGVGYVWQEGGYNYYWTIDLGER